jgi:hypothetical protein
MGLVAILALAPNPATRAQLVALLEAVRTGPSRVAAGIEPRMIPSIAPKERHVAFRK